ncbi:MAG TPA: 4Fe-4S binding protein [Bacilli bacterium]|jgi:Fe-S-cluster-containing hydrogenase component 2|nr:4Fe-4S binding protein [Bacilli bacterium]
MLTKTGVPTKEMVLSKFPNRDTLKKPKAILECYEAIPCNPCATSCPFDAIVIEDGMTGIPSLIADRCTGCGQCVIACPGLSITVAQLIDKKALFKIPYEFSPYPKTGEIWHGLNRNGEVICDAQIKQVLVTKNSKTALVTVLIDEAYLYDFATIKRYER